MAFMCNRMVTRASITGNVDSKQGRAALKAYIKDTLPDNILRNHKIRKSSLKIRIKLLLIKLRAVRMLSIITKTRIHE